MPFFLRFSAWPLFWAAMESSLSSFWLLVYTSLSTQARKKPLNSWEKSLSIPAGNVRIWGPACCRWRQRAFLKWNWNKYVTSGVGLNHWRKLQNMTHPSGTNEVVCGAINSISDRIYIIECIMNHIFWPGPGPIPYGSDADIRPQKRRPV